MSISKTNQKLVQTIINKLEKRIKNSRSLITFKTHIESIKGSLTELKKFNEKCNKLNDNINTLSKLNKLDVEKRKRLRELKSLSPPTFNYKKEIERSTHTFNLPVFKNHKSKINKVVDLIHKYKLINKNFVVSQKMRTDVKAIYRGKEVLQFGLKGKFNRQEVQRLGNKISEMMKDVSGEIAVSLKYDYGWRSGYFTNLGEAVKLYNPADSDIDYVQNDYNEIFIYMLEDPSPNGGKSNNNDCLYDCLKQVLNNI